MNKSKPAQLDEIKARIITDRICPELAAGASQLVFGDGNPDAELVFIGEAPGKNEDLQGLPFVGAAGQFLNEMLASIGFKRADVYITNIVKYRPADNRDPYPDEKIAFLPYLREQLAVIEPKIVITLGRHSMECFLPDLKISRCHGQPKRIRIQNSELGLGNAAAGNPGADAMQGAAEQRTEAYSIGTSKEQSQAATPQRAASDGGVAGSAGQQAVTSWVILPLFHPAAALYNGGMRQTLIDDFMKIPQILEQVDKLPEQVAPAAVVQPVVEKPTAPAPTNLQLEI